MRSRLDGDIRRQSGEMAPRWVHTALHELCQPLTALECRLYLSNSELQTNLSGTAEPWINNPAVESRDKLQHGLRQALTECGRMMEMVRAMQERMAHEEQSTSRNAGDLDHEQPRELAGGRAADRSAIRGASQRRRRAEAKTQNRIERPSMDSV